MLNVIDVEGIAGSEDSVLLKVAADVGAACRDAGFFYIRNHGVPEEVISHMTSSSAALFALPREEKERLAITRSPHNRGYVGISTESLNLAEADQKEAFNIGLDLAPSDPDVISGRPFRGVNVWPPLSGFRKSALDYFQAMWRLGMGLHRAIAVNLGMPASFFADKFDCPMATLRLLHYPPRRPGGGELPGAGEHTDYGSLTILLTDDAGGLEVRHRDGGWVEAPPIPGAFICNIGDCLMRWSNDTYVSTTHRVANPRGRDRYSIAFFLDPNPDALIACLPGCEGGGAKYPPVIASDYLTERLVATYGPRSAPRGK